MGIVVNVNLHIIKIDYIVPVRKWLVAASLYVWMLGVSEIVDTHLRRLVFPLVRLAKPKSDCDREGSSSTALFQRWIDARLGR